MPTNDPKQYNSKNHKFDQQGHIFEIRQVSEPSHGSPLREAQGHPGFGLAEDPFPSPKGVDQPCWEQMAVVWGSGCLAALATLASWLRWPPGDACLLAAFARGPVAR